jgi:cysteine synthase
MQVSATPSSGHALPYTLPYALQLRLPTPLLRLQRSGERRVWLKHEGGGLSGSVYDRIVAARANVVTPGHVVVHGATPFAYAVTLGLRPRGTTVTVVVDKVAGRRMRTLLHGAGAHVRTVSGDAAPVLASLLAGGAVLWSATDAPWAAERALRDIADEVGAQLGVRPAAWSVPDLGLSQKQTALALGVRTSALVRIADDAGRQRALEGAAACRRQQVAHREGILLSPLGAEVVDAAIGLADRPGAVCAVVPEDGRRYVGWW